MSEVKKRRATIARIQQAASLLAEQMRLEADRIPHHLPSHEMRQAAYEIERYSARLVHSRGRKYE